uniref:Uncharacterized protein n=1 Tax=Panagrellus redivivus TaxID=6233 RepID=A0A7E4V3S6_PANRE
MSAAMLAKRMVQPLRSCKPLSKSLQVEWEDGLRAEFPFCWLRDATAKRPALVHLDVTTKPESVHVDGSRDMVTVLWPRLRSTYSSTFLRNNAHLDSSDSSSPGSCAHSTDTVPASRTVLGGKLFLSTHQTPVAPSLVMGQCEWTSAAQEPSTLWPHLGSVPSLVVIDALQTGSALCPAQLTLIDSEAALARLAATNPKEFEFLRNCELEYTEGPFRAFHPVYELGDDGQVLSTTFNNTTRSTSITTKSLETLYLSLQKFGRACAEVAQTVNLYPGRRLIVDNRRVLLGAPAQAQRKLLLRLIG